MNVLNISGNLTGDLTLKYTANGKAYSVATVAINNGKETDFLPIKVWGEYGVKLIPILVKGKKVFATGTVENIEYTNKEGKKAYYTEMVVNQIQF